MKLLKSTAASLILLVSTAVFAQSMPAIDQRQANQAQRIQQGAQSGALTPNEAARLERGQQHVQNMENRAKADGVVTSGERRRLRHAQDVQSRRIAHEKHDRQHDYNHNGRVDRPYR